MCFILEHIGLEGGFYRLRFNKKWKKVLQPDKGKYGIYKKAGIVLLLSIVMFSAVYVTDNHRQLAQDENGNRILERKGQGEGKKTEKIQMETGEWKEKMKVQISEKKYAKEEQLSFNTLFRAESLTELTRHADSLINKK